jgi:Zn-finger nucleic acid-binding protein
MKCPRCNSLLTEVEYEGVEVLVCSDCRGEWLHAEELQKVVEHHDHVFNAKEIAVLEAVNKPILTMEDQARDVLNCPYCETIEMERFNYADTSGVMLHKCLECGGIWADKDQLEKIEELVDGWKACLNKDTAKYGGILKKINTEEQNELDRDVTLSRFGFVNAFLRRFTE